MSSLDSLIATAGEGALLSGLDYSVLPSSSAVTDKKIRCRAYPTSASTLTPTGNNSCRIRLGGSGMVEAGSAYLQFTIRNTGGSSFVPAGGPWCCWGNVRVLSGGVELENVLRYGLYHETFYWKLLPIQDQLGVAAVAGFHGSGPAAASFTPNIGTIEAGERVTVIHKLALAPFLSGKTLPISHMPLEIELFLAPVLDWAPSGSTYEISSIQLLYNEQTVDEAVSSSLYKALMASRILALPMLCASQQVIPINTGATSVDATVIRAFSRLSSVWVTFHASTQRNVDLFMPATSSSTTGATPALDDGTASWYPQVRLSVGAKNVPDAQPCASLAEHMLSLCETLGYTPNLTRDSFSSKSFVVCFDLRRIMGDHGSAISTRSGDLVRISIQNINAAISPAITSCVVTTFAYSVAALRESGVTLLN